MGTSLPRFALLAAAVAAASGCASAGEGPDRHLSPFLERDRPVAGAPRTTDAAIPFFHLEEGAARRETALRPFWRRVETDRGVRTEVLYPLYRQFRGADGTCYSRLFPFWWRDELPTSRGPDTDTAIAPILWWGEEPGGDGYFLFLPFGGTVREKLFVDEGTFVLFPLYLGSRNGEYRGTHLLWPLVHFGSGGGRSSVRVLPFWSASDKEGVYRRRALLWPIVHWATEDMDTPHPIRSWMVWPLVGRESASDGYSATTVLWPFFNWADGPRITARSLPYPFYRTRVVRDGAGEVESELLWLWPFYGRYDGPGDRSRFYAWPLVFSSETVEGGLRTRGLTVAGVFSRWATRPADAPEDAPEALEWKLWPLAEGRSTPDGAREWRTLSLIPFLRWEEMDANGSVFVELYRHRRGPDGSVADDALFSLIRSRRGPEGEFHRVPGLFRVERSREGSSWSLLEGLLGGSVRRGGGTSLRLLWFLNIPLTGGGGREGGGGR